MQIGVTICLNKILLENKTYFIEVPYFLHESLQNKFRTQ